MLNKSKTELITLAVIGSVIVFLVLGMIIAVKPNSLFKKARESTRLSQMETVLSAVYVYAIDNQGFFPPCIPEEGAVDITTCTELLPYLYRGQFPVNPSPDAKYMIEHASGTETKIRVFSTDPEKEGTELIR